MSKRKPRHSKQNVLIRQGSTSVARYRIINREWYTTMCDTYVGWREFTELVCIIPYPSPELFNH